MELVTTKRTVKRIQNIMGTGKNNKADLFTKIHSPQHHRKMRPKYILKGFNITELYDQFYHLL